MTTSKYTINVGLNNPVTGAENSLTDTINQTLNVARNVTNIAVKQSDTERTLIVDFDVIYGSLRDLSDLLQQDCVAVYDHDVSQGFLIGSSALKWGEFNVDYFLFI